MILVRITIDVATVLYVLAVASGILKRDRLARVAWTLGCAFFIAHVVAAFHFVHHWSHADAYQETARRTAEIFGQNVGSGIYFNYVFAILWIVDACWQWAGARPRWFRIAVQVFFAFMFFNATIVFAGGTVRWWGITAAIGLAALWLLTD